MITDLKEIKKLRRKLGLTQSQLSKQAGVSQSLIAKIESGKIQPTFQNVTKISYALDLAGEEVVKLEDIMVKTVISCKFNEPVSDIIKVMRKHGISQLPVYKNNKIIGLISESTILDKVVENISNLKAIDVMVEAPPIVNYKTQIKVVSQLLKNFSIVLVSKRGEIVGLVSKYDIIGVASA